MDGKDRRVSERRHTIYFSEVHNKNERSLMGYVVDISMAGLMILTKKKIDGVECFSWKLYYLKSWRAGTG